MCEIRTTILQNRSGAILTSWKQRYPIPPKNGMTRSTTMASTISSLKNSWIRTARRSLSPSLRRARQNPRPSPFRLMSIAAISARSLISTALVTRSRPSKRRQASRTQRWVTRLPTRSSWRTIRKQVPHGKVSC